MERVETDLNKSKQAREKQSREFSKQIEEERNQHERKVFITENPLSLEFHVIENIYQELLFIQERSIFPYPWIYTKDSSQ